MSNIFADEIEKISGINVYNCYQCGKCSAGCAFAGFMETPPNRFMRLIQMGLRKEVLACDTYSCCGACITCSSRCPREIDVLKVINTVRNIAVKEKVKPKKHDAHLFDEIFFENIINNDRLSEFSSAFNFNLRSGHYFKDISLFPVLLQKGKLSGGESVHTKKIAEIVKRFSNKKN